MKCFEFQIFYCGTFYTQFTYVFYGVDKHILLSRYSVSLGRGVHLHVGTCLERVIQVISLHKSNKLLNNNNNNNTTESAIVLELVK